MSEWVDFSLYALQAMLLWIALPAWGARCLRPLASRGGAWLRGLQAWGVCSVLALLAYRLDAVPPPLSAHSLHRSGWEALLMTSNLMLTLGLAGAAGVAWRFVRWMKNQAALQNPDSEQAFALTRDEMLPRRLQNFTYALVLLGLLARPVAALLRPDRVPAIWGNFITGLVLALLLLLAAGASVMRSPNHLDQVLGERYRRMEVGICYLLMASLALLEMAGLALELAGLGSRRHAGLLVAGFVSILLGSLMLLPARTPQNAP